jgi:hypothetical protein
MRTEFGELTLNTVRNRMGRRMWKAGFAPDDWRSMSRAAVHVGATPDEISALKRAFEGTSEAPPQMPCAKDRCVIGMNYGRLVYESDGKPAIVFEYCPKCGNKFNYE